MIAKCKYNVYRCCEGENRASDQRVLLCVPYTQCFMVTPHYTTCAFSRTKNIGKVQLLNYACCNFSFLIKTLEKHE